MQKDFKPPGAAVLKYCAYVKIPRVDEKWQPTGTFDNYLIFSTSAIRQNIAGRMHNDLVKFMYGRTSETKPGSYATGSTTIDLGPREDDEEENDLSKPPCQEGMLGLVTGNTGEGNIGNVMRIFNVDTSRQAEFEKSYRRQIGTFITMTPEDLKAYIGEIVKDNARCKKYFANKILRRGDEELVTEDDLSAVAETNPELFNKWIIGGHFTSFFPNPQHPDKLGYLDYKANPPHFKFIYNDALDEPIEQMREQGYVQVYRLLPPDEKQYLKRFYDIGYKSEPFLREIQMATMGVSETFSNVQQVSGMSFPRG